MFNSFIFKENSILNIFFSLNDNFNFQLLLLVQVLMLSIFVLNVRNKFTTECVGERTVKTRQYLVN